MRVIFLDPKEKNPDISSFLIAESINNLSEDSPVALFLFEEKTKYLYFKVVFIKNRIQLAGSFQVRVFTNNQDQFLTECQLAKVQDQFKKLPSFFSFPEEEALYKFIFNQFGREHLIYYLQHSHDEPYQMLLEKRNLHNEDLRDRIIKQKQYENLLYISLQLKAVLEEDREFDQRKLNQLPLQIKYEVKALGFKEKHKVLLNFDDSTFFNYKNRVNVLIGANGVGKTQVLKQTSEYIKQHNFFSEIIFFNHFEEELKGIIKHLRLKPRSQDHFKKSLTKLQQVVQVSFHTVSKEKVLREVFKSFFDVDHVLIPIDPGKYIELENFLVNSSLKQDEKSEIILFKDDNNVLLSPGQLVVLNFVVDFLIHVEPRSFILIDELENFLHPNLISMLMRILNELLVKTHSHCLVSTHSVFLVREVPSDYVIVYKLDETKKEKEVQTFRPVIQTLGCSLDRLAGSIFGDYSVRSKEIDDFFLPKIKSGEIKKSDLPIDILANLDATNAKD